MGKLVHRKPVWGWSVVLLSTLLLSSSPTTAAAMLHALAQAASLAEASVVPGATRSVDPSPRRTKERDALAAARGEQPLRLRLDTEPDTIVLVFPALSLLLAPDDDAPLAPSAAASNAAPSLPIAATAPRVPLA